MLKAAFTILALPAGALAHDVPTDVNIQAFFKPEGRTLRLLVRAPLKAMQDVEFPQKGPGYLDLPRAEASLRDAAALWVAPAFEIQENGARLPAPEVVEVRAALQSDRSFADYEAAAAHLTGPRLRDDTLVAWDQVLLDVLLEYPISSDRSEFSIHPGLGRLGLSVTTGLRFLPPGKGVRAFQFHDDPGMVELDPRWHQAALRFVRSGFFHILDGIDHLLFLFCLVIPFRRFRSLIWVVTSFTAAHSVTLIASAYGMAPEALWFPPLVETLIATSIVYMALENIVGGIGITRRWLIAFAFGLVHGFGFSFALRETLQFAGSHMLTSLLAFNVGVELGQLLVLALLVPALGLLFRYVVAERIGTIILSAIVAHSGWHWMTERGAQLAQFPFPAASPALWTSAVFWIVGAAILAALLWFVLRPEGRRTWRGWAQRLRPIPDR
jgi:hypothetical protein